MSQSIARVALVASLHRFESLKFQSPSFLPVERIGLSQIFFSSFFFL